MRMRTPWYHWLVVALLSVAALSGIASAISPFRANAGVQMTAQASWQGPTGVVGTYYKTGSGLMVRNADNSETGPLTGVTFPIQNGTSTNTFNFGGAMNGSAVAESFRSTNANTVGDKLMSIGDTGELAYFGQTSSTVYEWKGTQSIIGIRNSSTSGLIAQGGVTYLYASGSAIAQTESGDNSPVGDGTTSSGLPTQRWANVWSYRYSGVSQAPAFSATVAVNCTNAGETVHVGTVNANVTGATMTSGSVGEKCTIIWAKDSSGTGYTITWSGTNVRASSAEAMSTAASSLFIQRFEWDDRLGTPAWVEVSSKQTP